MSFFFTVAMNKFSHFFLNGDGIRSPSGLFFESYHILSNHAKCLNMLFFSARGQVGALGKLIHALLDQPLDLAGNLQLLQDAKRLELQKEILFDFYRGCDCLRFLLRLLFLVMFFMRHLNHFPHHPRRFHANMHGITRFSWILGLKS